MSSPAPPTRGRRLQFGLGTMLVVVTIFALWLGWEVRFIRERQAFLQWIKSQEPTGGFVIRSSWSGAPAPIPFWRRWLGDEPENLIELPAGSMPADRDQAKALFPEAVVKPER